MITFVNTLQDVEVYQVGRAALITLQPKTGFVGVLSLDEKELNGCYMWSHRGEQTLHEFLISSSHDKSYMLNKLFDPSGLKQFDLPRTHKEHKELGRYIIDQRLSGDLDRVKARELFDAVYYAATVEDVAELPILIDTINTDAASGLTRL